MTVADGHTSGDPLGMETYSMDLEKAGIEPLIILGVIWFIGTVFKNIKERTRGIGDVDQDPSNQDRHTGRGLNDELERMLRGDIGPASRPPRPQVRPVEPKQRPEVKSPPVVAPPVRPPQTLRPQSRPQRPAPVQRPSTPPARYRGEQEPRQDMVGNRESRPVEQPQVQPGPARPARSRHGNPVEVKPRRKTIKAASAQAQPSATAMRKKTRRSERYRLSPANLRHVVILSEILQPPLALRKENTGGI
jgi:hypothetical protein